jgi:hypothetical protein
MACSRGAASPDTHTQRRLFAASAGYCQNPACSRELFIHLPGKGVHIGEMAHVFAANNQGPRAQPKLSEAERGAFENLILLCPTCHTIIDKAPDQYPDTTILGWKREHATKLRSMFGVVRFDTRAEVRSAIEGQLRENRTIFHKYGPHIEAAFDPESGVAERWRRKVLSRIIPNNRRVLAFLDANLHLLEGGELDVLEDFRQHVDDLEARHLEDHREGGVTFPEGMTTIMRD